MKTKPILFSTQMVRAILKGNKTQTRRIIKFPNNWDAKTVYPNGKFGLKYGVFQDNELLLFRLFPKFEIGTILWARETWRIVGWNVGEPFKIQFKDGSVINDIYLNEERAIDYNIQCTDQCIDAGLISDDGGFFHFELKDCPTKWRPSIFMPKEAARIFLKVTNVRVERLHDISESNIIQEGVIWDNSFANPEDCSEDIKYIHYLRLWMELWIKINGKESWDKNPFVWVYDFELTEKPENFIQ